MSISQDFHRRGGVVFSVGSTLAYGAGYRLCLTKRTEVDSSSSLNLLDVAHSGELVEVDAFHASCSVGLFSDCFCWGFNELG